MLKGVLFDMDGILFDTERLFEEMDTKVAGEMGFTISRDVYMSQVGVSNEAERKVFCEALGPTFDFEVFRQRVYDEMERAILERGIPVMPGAEELLRWLKQEGWKVAVASSSSVKSIQRNLRLAGFTPLVDAVVSGDMVVNSKPAPDIFLAAAEAVGLSAPECAGIEDSHNGVRASAAAGCVTIMVPDVLPATDEMRQLADAVLPSLAEVRDFLLQYNQKQGR